MDSANKEIIGGKNQIILSKGNMDFVVRTTTDDITSFKLKYEKLEKEKFETVEKKRQERYTDIQQEAIESNRKCAAIEMKWSDLFDLDECTELFKEIESQKKEFKDIESSKDGLISTLLEELKKKSMEYVKEMKEQSDDVEKLVFEMRNQFFELRDKYIFELDQIEQEHIRERDFTLQSNEKDLQSLFDYHTEMERRFVEERAKREEKFMKKIEKLRIEGAKTYADLKITMETDIQNLEKCFEDMKALYQLNAEKLDYNLKILKEKYEDNAHLFDELKRKEQTLSTKLKNLRKDFNLADEFFKNENKKLTTKYNRITRQFKELQRKFKHFEKADLDRYNEIQKMNEEEVSELKEKILKCDMTIHIQQLGMKWEPEQNQDENAELEQQTITKEASREEEEETKYEIQGIDEERLSKLLDIILDQTDYFLDDLVHFF